MSEQANGYSVLICERDKAVIAQIRQTLYVFQWRIVGIATSIEEAVEQAQTHKPEIILMALTLERECDGLAATRRIRTLCPTAVALLSEDTSEAIVKAGIEAGACALFEKPLDMTKFLLALIEVRGRFERLQIEIEFTEKLKGLNLERGLDKMKERSWNELQSDITEKRRKTKKTEFIH